MTIRSGLFSALAALAVGCAHPSASGAGAARDDFSFHAARGALRAQHPTQDLAVAISPDEVVLSDVEAGRPIGLRLESLGGAPVGAAVVEHDGARVSLVRPGVTEWYVHGEAGLEQGFTIPEAPPGASPVLELVLAVDAEGYTITSASDERIELTRGDRSIEVAGLFAYDADTRALPAHMAIADGRMRLEVETTGARYPIVIDPTWTEIQRLTSSDGSPGGQMGWSIAVSGDTAVFGAPTQATSVAGVLGAAYVFVRGPTGWVQQAKLERADGAPNDRFGASVAISGDTIVVGAPLDDDAGDSSGSAYVYTRSGTTWSFDRKLTAADAAASHEFGGAVSVDGDYVAVGARRVPAVYVFVRGASGWTQQARITRNPFALSYDFGVSVSLSGSSLLVGADWATGPGGEQSGAAYVYVRSGTTWTEQAELSSLAGAGEHFGYSVALDGDDAIVGAPDYAGGYNNVGRVQFYRRIGTTWGYAPETAALPPRRAEERLGTSVALSGDIAVAGMPRDYVDGVMTGSAVIWARSSGTWSGILLDASDGASGDQFGMAVGAAPGFAFVGRRGTRSPDPGGTVYVYALAADDGTACTSGSTCASGICVDAVCCNSACGGGASDCQACSIAAGGTSDGTCTPLSTARAPTVTCRSAIDACDRAEVCSSGSAVCPSDAFAPSSTVCRAAAGACDAAETCTGTSAACPADALVGVGSTCRAATGVCDVAEACTGTSAACPADALVGAGSTCRAAAGVCDRAEACTGASAECPDDVLAAADTTCRASAGECDVAETCTGSTASCPADAARPEGTACGGALLGPCDAPDVCGGTIGATAHCDTRFASADVECRAASCTGGAATERATCSGAAVNCPAASTSSCDPYVCGATACLSTCSSDADCDVGRVCVESACLEPGVDAGMPDGGPVVADDAGAADDAGLADDAGSATDADTMDPDAGARDAAIGTDAGGGPSEGGCACSAPGGTRAAPHALGLALALLAMVIARRRAR